MMRILLMQFLFFLLFLNTTRAQVYSITNYTTADGLINNRTHTLNQDALGYIWIGTDNGICRYDGKQFKYFFLPGIDNYYFSNTSRRLGDAVLISTTYGPVLCKGDEVKPVLRMSNKKFRCVESIQYSPDQYLMADALAGLFLIDSSTAKLLPEIYKTIDDKYPLCLLADTKKNIWVGGNKYLYYYEGGNLKKPVKLPFFEGKYINGIKSDPAGNLYIISLKHIYKIPATLNPILYDTIQQPIITTQWDISCFVHNGPASIWLTNYVGATQYDSLFNPVRTIAQQNGLSSILPWDVFEDANKNIWFSTENGISKLPPASSKKISLPNNDYQYIKTLSFTQTNDLILGTNVNLYTYVNNKLILQPIKTSSNFLEDRLLHLGSNEVLISMQKKDNLVDEIYKTKLYVYSNGKLIETSRYQKELNRLGAVVTKGCSTDDEGNIWLSTAQGIGLFKNRKLYTYPMPMVGAKTFIVRSVARDKMNHLWIGTDSALVRYTLRMAADSFTLMEPKLYKRHVPASLVIKILVDKKGNIICGLSQGTLLILSPQKNDAYKITKINYPALSSLRIKDLLETPDGRIWIGSSFGIDILEWNEDGSYSIVKDAFAKSLCGKNIYFLKYKNDQVYVGTTGCMSIIPATKISTSARQPRVFFSRISVGNKINTEMLYANELKLDSDSNTINFEYISPSYDESPPLYKYRLLPIQKNWSLPSTQDNVTYTQLKPGSYSLQVLAKHSEGNWSTIPAIKKFIIATPYYQTWWFFALLLLVISSILYLLYRYRINQMRKMYLMRQHISADLHDDIGGTLSSISMLSNVVKKKIITNPQESISIAEKIEETSRQMIFTMSDIVWNINPGNDTLTQLISRLREYMSIVLAGKIENYQLVSADRLDELPLPMKTRKEIYLVCKEIIHNCSKYSKAENFKLNLSLHKNEISILAKDDGIGMDALSISKGNGITNIKARVKALGGEANLIAEPGQGVIWEIDIPLK